MSQIRFVARVVLCVCLVGLFAAQAAAGQIGFVYALQQVDGGANQIHGFRLDQTTGALVALAGFPVSSGGTGTNGNPSEQVAYSNGRLFVVNDGSNTLTVFDVNPATGALTASFGAVALGDSQWLCVAVHPSGSPVVVGGGNPGTLASITITGVTATAAVGSPFLTGIARPFSCQFSQTGGHVYAGGNSGSTIAGFSVNAGTGVLTALAGSPFDSGAGNPVAYATDTAGRLFVANLATAQLRVFTTAAGIPTAVTGNPFTSGLSNGVHGVVHPAGYYMVADRGANQVGVYDIALDGASTTLTPIGGSPFQTGGTLTTALALSSNGGHLVVANGTSRNLMVYQVNQATGALSNTSAQPPNALGTVGIVTGVAFAPGEAGFVYALRQVQGSPNQVHGFRIHPATGALIALPGFPVAAGLGGNGSFSEHMAYQNGRLYVVNEGAATVSAFKVNRSTGALTPLPFSPIAFSGDGACVVVHPSGSPVLVASNAGFHSFDVNATTATAAPGSPFATAGASPFSCTLSTNGGFAYTGGNVGTTFAGFAVAADTGVLTPLAGTPFSTAAGNPVGYASDDAGRLYVSNFGTGLRVFTTTNGVPTDVAGNPFASGLAGGVQGIVSPFGFYILADRSANRVGVFQIAGSGGGTTLSAVTGSPFVSGGSFTLNVTQTTDGVFVVSGHGVSRNLSVFRINPATGALTTVLTQPVDTLGPEGLVTGIAFAAAVPPFIDDPLTALPPLSRVIKTIHITELRSRIDTVRAQYGLGPFAYTTPALTAAVTVIQGAHISDLRTALAQVYTAAGIPPPSYTDPALPTGTIVVKAVHITQLRAAVIAIE
jgi:6-phosphogluconolactonase